VFRTSGPVVALVAEQGQGVLSRIWGYGDDGAFCVMG
jgi:hypothetical protein